MLSYVSFHVALSRRSEQEIQGANRKWTSLDAQQLLPLMFASAERADPGCRKVVLTDEKTPFPAAAPFEVLRMDLDPESLMPGRCDAYAAFLEAANGHVAFVDGDLLVAESLEPVFASQFDVALTFRDHDTMPINVGVHFAHGSRLHEAARFHRRTREVLLDEFGDWQLWRGTQYAMSRLVDRADFKRQRALRHHQNGFDVQLLPCDVYNFSAPSPMDGFYPDKAVLHFKGPRKSSMAAYWEEHLAGRSRVARSPSLDPRRPAGPAGGPAGA